MTKVAGIDHIYVAASNLQRSKFLFAAEAYAVEHFHAPIFKISVLTSRPELLAFYERRGYALNGEAQDYPSAPNVGQRVALGIRVLSLEKTPAPGFIQE